MARVVLARFVGISFWWGVGRRGEGEGRVWDGVVEKGGGSEGEELGQRVALLALARKAALALERRRREQRGLPASRSPLVTRVPLTPSLLPSADARAVGRMVPYDASRVVGRLPRWLAPRELERGWGLPPGGPLPE